MDISQSCQMYLPSAKCLKKCSKRVRRQCLLCCRDRSSVVVVVVVPDWVNLNSVMNRRRADREGKRRRDIRKAPRCEV